jgi:hypothetical protein
MLCRPALYGNSNALSLAKRALKDKFSTPTVPLRTVLQNRQVFLPDPVYVAASAHIYIYIYIKCTRNGGSFYQSHNISTASIHASVIVTYLYIAVRGFWPVELSNGMLGANH